MTLFRISKAALIALQFSFTPMIVQISMSRFLVPSPLTFSPPFSVSIIIVSVMECSKIHSYFLYVFHSELLFQIGFSLGLGFQFLCPALIYTTLHLVCLLRFQILMFHIPLHFL